MGSNPTPSAVVIMPFACKFVEFKIALGDQELAWMLPVPQTARPLRTRGPFVGVPSPFAQVSDRMGDGWTRVRLSPAISGTQPGGLCVVWRRRVPEYL